RSSPSASATSRPRSPPGPTSRSARPATSRSGRRSMTASFDPDRRPEDIGADSPASGEAKRQSIAGARGGPRQAQPRGKERQPPQSSGRRSKRHEHLPTARKSFSPEEDPSLQGRGGPSPEMIARSQQGIEPRSGS